MIFNTVKNKLPSVGDLILAKIRIEDNTDDVNYYVFRVCKSMKKDSALYLEEASGEQYWTCNLEDVIAWISLKELDEQVDYIIDK